MLFLPNEHLSKVPPRHKTVITGAGPGSFIAQHWTAAARGTDRYEIIGGAPSRKHDGCNWFTANYHLDGKHVGTDLRQVLAGVLADGINPVLMMCTPTGEHVEQLCTAAELKVKEVLTDKPPVTSMAEWKQVAAALEANGGATRVGVTYQHTFNAVVAAIAEYVAANRAWVENIGAVFYQDWLLTDPKIRQSGWRLSHPGCGILDIYTHAANLAARAAGSPIVNVSASKLGTGGRHGAKVFDNGDCAVEFGNGLRGTVAFSQVLPGKADDIGVVVKLTRQPWAMMFRMEWGPDTLFLGRKPNPNPDRPGDWTPHLRGKSAWISDQVNGQFGISPPGHIQGWSDYWRTCFCAASGAILTRAEHPCAEFLPPMFKLPVPDFSGDGKETIAFAEAVVRGHENGGTIKLSDIT